ncbi:hypothetical protein T11_15338 [Trichinella zimbabwensis]|uniref:Uncharacterized protein n=1 Tax=Trichinella zimbabwensis TaxID=268475 RepID=A0A0V1HA14_9BILA|nr:hypothetical protein T11_15338 [Trichinella zimbabwensis]
MLNKFDSFMTNPIDCDLSEHGVLFAWLGQTLNIQATAVFNWHLSATEEVHVLIDERLDYQV